MVHTTIRLLNEGFFQKRKVSFDSLDKQQGLPGDASGKEPAYQCRRSKRPGLDSLVGKIPWRRQPTPVSLPGESYGQRSLAGYIPQDLTELDTAEAT